MSEISSQAIERQYANEIHLLRSEVITGLDLNLDLDKFAPDYTGIYELSKDFYHKDEADIDPEDDESWQKYSEEIYVLAAQEILLENGRIVDAAPVNVKIVTNLNFLHISSDVHQIINEDYNLLKDRVTFDVGSIRLHGGHPLYGSIGYLIIEDGDEVGLSYYPAVDARYNSVDFLLAEFNVKLPQKEIPIAKTMRELIARITNS